MTDKIAVQDWFMISLGRVGLCNSIPVSCNGMLIYFFFGDLCCPKCVFLLMIKSTWFFIQLGVEKLQRGQQHCSCSSVSFSDYILAILFAMSNVSLFNPSHHFDVLYILATFCRRTSQLRRRFNLWL